MCGWCNVLYYHKDNNSVMALCVGVFVCVCLSVCVMEYIHTAVAILTSDQIILEPKDYTKGRSGRGRHSSLWQKNTM